MTPEDLKTLIESDPTASSLAASEDYSTLSKRCSELVPPKLNPTPLTELSILNLIVDPVKAETILQTIEAVALGNPLVKRALKWIQPGAPGLDFGNVVVREMLTKPLEDGGLGLDPLDVAPLLQAAETPQMFTPIEVRSALKGF